MSGPVTFDPAAYVAEMHEVGVRLAPSVLRDGRRLFSIKPGPNGGIPGEVMGVAAKWVDAAKAHPDWVGAVHDEGGNKPPTMVNLQVLTATASHPSLTMPTQPEMQRL